MKIVLTFLFFLVGGVLLGQRYSFFKPLPDSLLPEMSTDRPDVTESPESVPAGHFQFESDLIRYERYLADNRIHLHTNYGNYKFGLFDKTDVQLVFPMQTTVFTSGQSRKSFGAPYATLRLKRKITGNKSKFALGAIAYYTFPIGSQLPQRAAGITFPMSFPVSSSFSINGQLQFEQNLLQKNSRTYSGTLNAGYVFNRKLQGFTEGVFTVNTGVVDLLANTGLVLCINSNFRIDAGINYSLFNFGGVLFLGTSIRV